MKPEEIKAATNAALYRQLRLLQEEFDSCQDGDRVVAIYNEHVAVMKELKSRGLSELDIEKGKLIKPVT